MKKIILMLVLAFVSVNCTNEPASTETPTESKESKSSNLTAKGTYSECDPVSINIMAGQLQTREQF